MFNSDAAMTLEEVAQHFGVTRERIRQIEAAALRKIKRHPDAKKLKELLRLASEIRESDHASM